MTTLLEAIQTLLERMKRDLAMKEDIAALRASIRHLFILNCITAALLVVTLLAACR